MRATLNLTSESGAATTQANQFMPTGTAITTELFIRSLLPSLSIRPVRRADNAGLGAAFDRGRTAPGRGLIRHFVPVVMWHFARFFPLAGKMLLPARDAAPTRGCDRPRLPRRLRAEIPLFVGHSDPLGHLVS